MLAAWWLLNDNPERGGEVDVMEWYGNGSWPGTTVHARLDGTSFDYMSGHRFQLASLALHVGTEAGMYSWQDYVEGMELIKAPGQLPRTGRSTARFMRCRPSSTSP